MAHCSWHQRRALVRAPSLFWEPITWRNFSCNHAIASTGSKSALSSRSGVHCLGGWHKGSWSRSFIRGLTIRSSRDRFAARLKWCRVPSRRAAQRSGLTQALDRSRENAGQQAKCSEPWALACSRLLILATNSVPARAAGTPFLGSAVRKERLAVLDVAQMLGSWSKATAGTGLTIRSSRDRFAASCRFC